MKKMIVGILAALTMILSGLAVTASPANAAAVVTCYTQSVNNYQTVKMGPFNDRRTMSIVLTVRYNDCKNRLGPNFVRPIGIRVQTFVSGVHMDCGSDNYTNPLWARGGYFETRWKVYFASPTGGQNFSLPMFSTPCSTNTNYDTGYRVIGKRTSVPLYVADHGGYATFRANAVADWRKSSDKAWSQFGKLYAR